jgi:hypothetical protein
MKKFLMMNNLRGKTKFPNSDLNLSSSSSESEKKIDEITQNLPNLPNLQNLHFQNLTFCLDIVNYLNVL